MHSVSSGFNLMHLAAPKLSQTNIILLGARKVMSSTYARAPTNKCLFPNSTRPPKSANSFNISSLYSQNGMGEKTSPWWTLWDTEKGIESAPPQHTCTCCDQYVVTIRHAKRTVSLYVGLLAQACHMKSDTEILYCVNKASDHTFYKVAVVCLCVGSKL